MSRLTLLVVDAENRRHGFELDTREFDDDIDEPVAARRRGSILFDTEAQTFERFEVHPPESPRCRYRVSRVGDQLKSRWLP